MALVGLRALRPLGLWTLANVGSSGIRDYGFWVLLDCDVHTAGTVPHSLATLFLVPSSI